MTPGGTVTVFVPCDVVDVRVRLGYDETLTPIEQILLRAVHAGAATVGELVASLGLGRRLIVDLVQDLRRAGYVRLVHAHAGVRVTDAVARRIEADTLAGMPSAECVDDRIQIMVDKLSGHVMPRGGTPAPGLAKWAVPVEEGLIRIANATSADIFGAISRGLDREERERADAATASGPTRRRRVLGAHIVPDDMTSAGIRWLGIDVRAATDPDTDRLLLTVVGDALPESRRAIASARLTRLAESRPNDGFVQALRAQALVGLIDAPSPSGAIARLLEQARSAASIPAGQRRTWHLALCNHARQLEALVADQTDREVVPRLILGKQHRDALLRLIDSARTQLVVSAPHITHDALAELTPAVEKALGRGVQVLLLWGTGLDEELTGPPANLLYQTALRADNAPRSRHRLLVPRTSARTGVRLAIADDHTALVSGWDVLAGDPRRSEIGLEVTAPGLESCRAVHQLLRWAHGAIPAHDMSRRLLVEPADFALRRRTADGSREPGVPAPARPSLPAPVPAALPREPDDGDGPEAADAARAWSDAWIAYAGRAADVLASRVRPPASIVIDGEHIDVFWHALRLARRRLVVTSAVLGDQVVNERLVSALSACLERGVTVTVSYGRPRARQQLPGGLTAGEANLGELRQRYPDLLRFTRSDAHAGALVWDDVAVVGAFDYLNIESVQARSRPGWRSEVSLLLSGPTIADEVARAMGAPALGRASAGSAKARPRRTGRLAAGADALAAAPAEGQSAFVAAQRILNEIAAGVAPAGAVDTVLGGSDRPWNVLDRLAENASATVLQVAAAMCLSHWPDQIDEQRRSYWRRWLAENLWNDRRYVEALLVRGMDDAARPSPALAVLAAARGTVATGAALVEAVILLDPPAGGFDSGTALAQRWRAERTAVLAVAIEQLIFDGSAEAADLIRIEVEYYSADPRTRLAESWNALARAALDYWSDASRPVPMDSVRAADDGRREREAQMTAWTGLDEALLRAGNTTLSHSASLRVHLHLFTAGTGVFTRLRNGVEARDVDALRSWLAVLPSDEADGLITAAAAEVAPGDKAMYGTYRKRYRRLLDSVIQQVRRTVAAADASEARSGAPADPAAEELLTAARSLARVLAREWDGLRADATALPDPEGHFVLDVLTAFEALSMWASRPDLAAAGGPGASGARR